jgi:sugar O-acyltransferase (sialic acid O-acetyltransferase NeuD family)
MAPAARHFVVVGAGGHGRVVADLARTLGHDVVGYADTDPEKLGTRVDASGATVIVDQATILACARGEQRWPFTIDAVALGVGDNIARARLLEQIAPAMLPPLIHPRSWVSDAARIGPGSVVLAGAVINAGARLEEGAIVNSGAIVEHDCIVGAAVHLSPGATLCGAVGVGARSWVAAAAVIIPGCMVGTDCMIGAGAVVIRDVPDGMTVVGNPARPVRADQPANASTPTPVTGS